MTKSAVLTDKAPAPFNGAPYNQAIIANGLVFTAGQVGFTPDGVLVDGGIVAQTHRTIDNLAVILEAAGSSLENLVKTTVFLQDLGDFAAVNAVYKERIPSPHPARSTFEVAKLPGGALIEIEAIATA